MIRPLTKEESIKLIDKDRQELWLFLSNEFNLTLTESELDDLINAVEKYLEKGND